MNLKKKMEENSTLENSIYKLQQQNDELRRGGSEYEYKYTQITQEYQTKFTTYETRIKQVSTENDDLRRRLQELGDVNRRLSEYENRIATMSQEIERLNNTLRIKVEESTGYEKRLRSLEDENERLRRSQSEMEYKYSQEWQSKITTYESRIRQFNQDKEGTEIRVKQMAQDNDDLRRQLQELSNVSRKVAEYENRIALMSQEIERLNGTLRVKVEDISGWENKFRALQQENENLKKSLNQLETKLR